MLKIKDNVDLSEKLFEKSDDEFDQLWAYDELLFDKDTREIPITQFNYCNDTICEKRIYNLLELYKADLVEKVKE